MWSIVCDDDVNLVSTLDLQTNSTKEQDSCSVGSLDSQSQCLGKIIIPLLKQVSVCARSNKLKYPFFALSAI